MSFIATSLSSSHCVDIHTCEEWKRAPESQQLARPAKNGAPRVKSWVIRTAALLLLASRQTCWISVHATIVLTSKRIRRAQRHLCQTRATRPNGTVARPPRALVDSHSRDPWRFDSDSSIYPRRWRAVPGRCGLVSVEAGGTHPSLDRW